MFGKFSKRGSIKMKVKEGYIPATFDEAIDYLYGCLEYEDVELIFDNPNSSVYHHSFCRILRNNWKLWLKCTALVADMNKRWCLWHADDMSGLIVESLWAKVHKIPIDHDAKVQVYREHWKKHGLNPLTGEPLER